MISWTINHETYALPVQTAELQHALDTLYDSGRLSELVDPHAMLAGAIDSDWPQPPSTPWPRPRLGSLYWPVVGLAHYAFGCFLVDEYTLGQIRAGMTSAGSNAITVNFTDDPTDDAEVARTVSMQFLAARPLVRTTADALTTDDNGTAPVDAWVVLLVDDRYRLLHTSVTSLTTTAWSDVFAAASVTVADAVDSDYLTPGERWSADKVKGRSLAWLMDIAALSVGSRIVNVPGSAPALQRPTGARKTALSDAHTAADTRFFGGGPIEDADVDPGMPNGVRVIFCAPSETTPATVDVTVQTTYAWPSTAHLTHWADAPAGTSSGNRSALAAQWETDWSAWQHRCYDTQYSGFVATPASGFCWAVEWYHDAERGYTRFTRPPHWYGYLLSTQEGSASTAATASAWKQPVRVATTTAGTLASSFANGSAVDGVTLATGDRILLKNQATAADNGIYVVASSGAPARATDATSGSDLLAATVAVCEGGQSDTIWLCTANATINVGTTALNWSQVHGTPNGQSLGPNSHAIASDNTWEDCSPDLPTLTLPSAGTYLLFGRIHFAGYVSANALTVLALMYARVATTGGAPIDGTQLFGPNIYQVNRLMFATGSFATVVTVAGATTLRWEAQRETQAGVTWAESVVGGTDSTNDLGNPAPISVAGKSCLGYVRLSP